MSVRDRRMDEFCTFAARLLDHQRRARTARKRRDWKPAGDSWF